MANEPTTPNSAPTTKSAPQYEKLSEESMSRVLAEVKSLQDDPRTTWRKKDDPPAKS
jgi:hypothetical protein